MQRNDEVMSRARRGGRATVALLLAGVLGACDALDRALDVDAPADVPAGSLDHPQHAQLLLNGAIGDFECAFGSYVASSALLADELDDATFTANRWPVPSRTLTGGDFRYATFSCESLGVYTPISTARWSADNILSRLEAWTDQEVEDRTRKIATAAAYSAYSHLILGEGFCSAAVDLSAELTPEQVFQRAEERFTQAIQAAQTAGAQEILNMALLGRARTRLNLGQGNQAVADAQLVPEGFVFTAAASTIDARRRNRVSEENRLGRVSIAPGYLGLTVDGEPDTRVGFVDGERTGVDAQTHLWLQTKYPDDATPYPLATWTEAQLIIAEVQGGQQAVDIINDLRARAGLPATFQGGSAAEILDAVIEERRRELFLESHRLGDIRRHNLPLTPAPGTAFSKGGTYGDARCFPLPDVERATNPNIS